MANPALPSIAQAIDGHRITPLQWSVFALCALVNLLDGWDTQSIGIVAPLMRKDLGLNPTELATVFSVSQVGSTVGALSFGILGDRFGRRPMILLATAIVAVFTFLTALTSGYVDLLVCRAIVGVGLAGSIPCILALSSEYAPKRIRGLVVTVVAAAYPLGAAVGGLLNGWIAAFHGWHVVFYLGGVLPGVLCLAIFVWLPESIQFLAARGLTDRVATVLGRLGLRADPSRVGALPGAQRGKRAPIRLLFVGPLAIATALLLALYFFAFATTKIFSVWFPSILEQAGLTVGLAGVAQASFNVGSCLGMAVSGRLVDRFGPGLTLTPALVICSGCVMVLSAMSSNMAIIFTFAALVGLFLGVGTAGAHAMAVQLYAPAIRSTGIGLGFGASRFGQVLSPMMVGLMLSAGAGAQAIYATVAVLPVLAGAAALLLVFRRGMSAPAAEPRP